MAVINELKLKDYATLLGTFCGFLAMVAAVGYNAYRFACFLLFLGIAADLLDGFLARKMNQMNALGRELDSLSDGIVFGVAPAVVAFKVFTGELTQTGIPGHTIGFMLIPAFIFICGAIIRLAWFNIAENEGYSGLPTPLSAGFLALCLTVDYYVFSLTGVPSGFNYFMHYFIPIAMILIAWLNITDKVVYGKTIRKKSGLTKYLILVNGALVVIVSLLAMFSMSNSRAIIVAMLVLFWAEMVFLISMGFYFKKAGDKAGNNSNVAK